MTLPALAPRDGRKPTCNACGFDLTGLPIPPDSILICPECGQRLSLEHAYSTTPQRLAEWLQEPAEPSPTRFLLTTFVVLVTGSIVAILVALLLYLILMAFSAWTSSP